MLHCHMQHIVWNNTSTLCLMIYTSNKIHGNNIWVQCLSKHAPNRCADVCFEHVKHNTQQKNDSNHPSPHIMRIVGYVFNDKRHILSRYNTNISGIRISANVGFAPLLPSTQCLEHQHTIFICYTHFGTKRGLNNIFLTTWWTEIPYRLCVCTSPHIRTLRVCGCFTRLSYSI